MEAVRKKHRRKKKMGTVRHRYFLYASLLTCMLLFLTGCSEKKQNDGITVSGPETENVYIKTEPERTEVREDFKAGGDNAIEDGEDAKAGGDNAIGDGEDAIEKQLDCLVQTREEWYIPDDTASWYYAVTDLDEDGYLELIRTTCGGTGFYSYSTFYAVKKDFTGITEMDTPWEEGESQPDFLYGSLNCYSGSKGCRYVVDDILMTGMDTLFYKYAVSKQGDTLQCELISYYDMIAYNTVDEYGKSVLQYSFVFHDRDGNEIEENRYYQIQEDYFKGDTSSALHFCFKEIPLDADQEEMKKQLRTSYEEHQKEDRMEREVTGIDYNRWLEDAISQYSPSQKEP